MNEFNVRIEQLPPMRVASASAVAEDAENQSWQKMKTWAQPRGLLKGSPLHIFGFDNCQPHPNHRYTIWISVERDVGREGEIEIFDFPGGLYAVATVHGANNIHNCWEKLANWRASSRYRPGRHQELEEVVGSMDFPPEDLTFNLYLPIEA